MDTTKHSSDVSINYTPPTGGCVAAMEEHERNHFLLNADSMLIKFSTFPAETTEGRIFYAMLEYIGYCIIIFITSLFLLGLFASIFSPPKIVLIKLFFYLSLPASLIGPMIPAAKYLFEDRKLRPAEKKMVTLDFKERKIRITETTFTKPTKTSSRLLEFSSVAVVSHIDRYFESSTSIRLSIVTLSEIRSRLNNDYGLFNNDRCECLGDVASYSINTDSFQNPDYELEQKSAIDECHRLSLLLTERTGMLFFNFSAYPAREHRTHYDEVLSASLRSKIGMTGSNPSFT